MITGGGRGIGRGLAAALSRTGSCVVSASLEHPAEPGEAGDLAPGHITEVHLDVRREVEVRALFESLDARARIRALVNCAGVGVFVPLDETRGEDWEWVVNTNLTGTFLCCREAIRRMRHTGGGRIVNIGSIAGATPLAGNGAYACSKAAIQMLTDIINVENAAHRIFATCIVLGAVYTGIWHSRPEFKEADMLPVSEVAELIATLLRQPDGVRVDALRVVPPKGIL